MLNFAPTTSKALLPQIPAVNDGYWRCGRIKVVEQTSVDANAPSDLVPAAVKFKGWTIGERGAPAVGAEVVGHHFCIPAID